MGLINLSHTLAKDYASMIKTGQVKSEADLARKLGISRVRVNQIVRLLKLDSQIITQFNHIDTYYPKCYYFFDGWYSKDAGTVVTVFSNYNFWVCYG
jgi:hypothetical protein|tara:strand:+ start:331 stop:621 length:291 start_codon:yes stop_codon:yes gene_type:complete